MEWIRVQDHLPNIYDFVLVIACFKGSGEPKPISIARQLPDRSWDFLSQYEDLEDEDNVGAWMDMEYSLSDSDITHWMPLPKEPI
jgi:hypothetical protein